MAGGKGTRLLPLTETRPKAMVPVANRPILAYIVDAVRRFGIDDIAIVVYYKRDQIMDYFGDSVSYCFQREASGTADALLSAKNFVVDEPFLVVNGDLFFDSLSWLGRDLGIAALWVEDASRYGKLSVVDGFLAGVEEKVGGSGWINAGIYMLNLKIFDLLEEVELSPRGEYELTDAISSLIQLGYKLRVYPVRGFWRDIGYPWDLLDVNRHILELCGGRIIGENCDISSKAVVEGPCIIGNNTVIRNSTVRPYSAIGDDCYIGDYCIIKNSIILNRTKIPHHNYVGDSIIGANCNLGAGTKIANVRLDEGNIWMNIKGVRTDSGRSKLGAILGDNVKTGVNVSIYPGIKIGSNAQIGANTVITRDVKTNTRVWVEQIIKERNLQDD